MRRPLALLLPAAILVAQNSDSPDARAARNLLGLAARHAIPSLKNRCTRSTNSNERLFAGYLLYRIDSNQFRGAFVHALPKSEKEVQAYLGCAATLPYSAEKEGNLVFRNDVSWEISFSSLQMAFIECVEQEDPTALHRFMLLQGRGDGAIGEGIASDFMDLYVVHPEVVVRHWALFEKHLSYLRGIDDWYDQATKEKTKAAYRNLFEPGDPRLAMILAEIDHSL